MLYLARGRRGCAAVEVEPGEVGGLGRLGIRLRAWSAWTRESGGPAVEVGLGERGRRRGPWPRLERQRPMRRHVEQVLVGG